MTDKIRLGHSSIEDAVPNSQLDPEPITIILTTLGAIGSIASIYSVAERQYTKYQTNQERRRRDHIYRSLLQQELHLIDTKEQFHRFRKMVEPSSGDRPFRFGEADLLFDDVNLHEYRKLTNELNRTLTDLNDCVFEVISALCTEISSDRILDGPLVEFLKLREHLNEVFFSSSTIEEKLCDTEALLIMATTIIHHLREWISLNQI